MTHQKSKSITRLFRLFLIFLPYLALFFILFLYLDKDIKEDNKPQQVKHISVKEYEYSRYLKHRQFFSDIMSNKYYLYQNYIDYVLDSIYTCCERKKLSPILIFSLIEVESGFKFDAVSNKGAYGLTQIHLPTWGSKITKKEVFNPKTNIDFGTTILLDLINKNNGDIKVALYKYCGGSNDYINKVLSKVGEYSICLYKIDYELEKNNADL